MGFNKFNNIEDQNNKNANSPTLVPQAFLEWFIGLFEGDGCISLVWKLKVAIGTQQIRRIEFDGNHYGLSVVTVHIDLRDRTLIKTIQSVLGFGSIHKVKAEGKNIMYRWEARSQSDVLRLIGLFNGNLILNKRQVDFEAILEHINVGWNLNIPLKPWSATLSLKRGWISGFTDAEGCFSTNVERGFKKKIRSSGLQAYGFVLNYQITQDGEREVLQTIMHLFQSTNKIYQSTNGRTVKMYNRIQISVNSCLIDYFDSFPLLSEKAFDYQRWRYLHFYRLENLPLRGTPDPVGGPRREMLNEKSGTELALAVQKTYHESLAVYKAESINFEQANKQALALNKTKRSAPRAFIHLDRIPFNHKTPNHIISRREAS